MSSNPQIILPALKLLLKPVSRFCLRHSLRIQDILEALKASLVESAVEQLEQSNTRITDSVLSVMTGLHRRDVVRIRSGQAPLNKAHDLVTKVLGQWQGDRRYLDPHGRPRALSYGTEASDFSKLVKLVSNDVTAASVLSELERTKMIERDETSLKLIERTYTPRRDPTRGFGILSDDIEDLVQAVEENLLLDPETPNMHFRTVYDRIDSQAIQKIRSWLLTQGQELHLKAREYLSQFDLDINPQKTSNTEASRVVISSFGRVGDAEQSTKSK